jgi:hypothetical protein
MPPATAPPRLGVGTVGNRTLLPPACVVDGGTADIAVAGAAT